MAEPAPPRSALDDAAVAPSTSAAAVGELALRPGGALTERQLQGLAAAALHHTGSYQRALLVAFLLGGAGMPFGALAGWLAVGGAVLLGWNAKRACQAAFAADAEELGLSPARARGLFHLALKTRRRLGHTQAELDEIEDGVERALVEALRASRR